MSFFGARLGSHVLSKVDNRKYITILDESEIEPGDYIEIQFYSLSGEYIDSISTLPEDSGYLTFELVVEKVGGLKSFNFEVSKNINLPLYNQMVIRFYINNSLWYIGELDYNPELDTSQGKLKFDGLGYWRYLDIKIEYELYTNKTLDYIIRHIIINYIYGQTPIIYDIDLISVPNITITKYEIKNKEVSKVFEYLLSLANYNRNVQQYKVGIDTSLRIYFNEISNDVIDGFFEGFQFQNPKVKTKKSEIVNRVNIQRAIEDSNTLEAVSVIEDLDSQEKYGIKEINLEISDYIDTDSAEKIAQEIIELKKDPLLSIELDNLITDSTPYGIGFYSINNKNESQKIDLNHCDNLNDWDISHFINSDIELDSNYVLSGKKCFLIIPQTTGNNEYIEFTLTDEIYYPEILKFYVRSNTLGELFKITVYDIDGNYEEFTPEILIINSYISYSLNLTLENIKKIRLTLLVTSNLINIYVDSFLLFLTAWRQRIECLEKITYEFKNNGLIASAIFGNDIFNFIKDIKKIENKTDNIYNIIGRL